MQKRMPPGAMIRNLKGCILFHTESVYGYARPKRDGSGLLFHIQENNACA